MEMIEDKKEDLKEDQKEVQKSKKKSKSKPKKPFVICTTKCRSELELIKNLIEQNNWIV